MKRMEEIVDWRRGARTPGFPNFFTYIDVKSLVIGTRTEKSEYHEAFRANSHNCGGLERGCLPRFETKLLLW